jgi:DNA-binding XRE family transcriptional regulator
MAAYTADVGRRMREARERNRPDLTSQEAAAQEIGVSGKQYGRWERGESQPRSDKWTPIAHMLRVPVEDLRGRPPALPEEELRAQLDRIEAKVDDALSQLSAMRVGQAVAAAAEEDRKRRGSARTSRTTAKKQAGG